MEHKMSLLPFEVKAVKESISNEIPYGVQLSNAPMIWDKGERGENIVVAVLDTGCDPNHPDLHDRIIGGKNFTSEGTPENFNDYNGHGTHVAGTIAATQDNQGVVGVAPKADLLICKVLDGGGSGSYQGITNGIRYAADWIGPNNEKVRVMNMSLGGPIHDPELYEAILYAISKGILVVVASGNEGDANENTLEYGYPANYLECVTVAACDKEKKLAYFSNNSRAVDVISAGVDVLSTYPTNKGKYAVLSGTSMATPHVAGALALIIKRGEKHFDRELSEAEIYALLAQSCCSLGYKASSEGHGLVDLENLNKKCTE